MAVGKGVYEDLIHSDSAGDQSWGGQHWQVRGGVVEAELAPPPRLGHHWEAICLHTQAYTEHHW